MNDRPNIALSRLREIGWSHWDPIGLEGADGAEDEYDSYLLQAAGRLWNGEDERAVASYLVDIEAEYMGLGRGPGIEERAIGTTAAINGYLKSLRP